MTKFIFVRHIIALLSRVMQWWCRLCLE